MQARLGSPPGNFELLGGFLFAETLEIAQYQNRSLRGLQLTQHRAHIGSQRDVVRRRDVGRAVGASASRFRTARLPTIALGVTDGLAGRDAPHPPPQRRCQRAPRSATIRERPTEPRR